jgi:hypothetical protein
MQSLGSEKTSIQPLAFLFQAGRGNCDLSGLQNLESLARNLGVGVHRTRHNPHYALPN